MRLRKDGQPDGRSTNKGTAGNRGGGRPIGSGLVDERRKMRSYAATDEEHELIKYVVAMVKKRPGSAEACAAALGDPPGGRPPTDKRSVRTTRALDAEWQQIKPMIDVIKYDVIRARQIVKKY